MVDINKALKDVVKKGKVHIGEKQTKAAIQNNTAKLIIFSQNCPYYKTMQDAATENNIPTYTFNGTSVELGTTCGKGYAVSSFAIINEGDSSIMQLIKKRT